MPRIFLVSPATCSGLRARQLIESDTSDLGRRLRSEGASIAEVFTFLSALYFRGKITYARAFARPPRRLAAVGSGIFVITPTQGLVDPDARVDAALLREFATVAVDALNPAYRGPLEESAHLVKRAAGPRCEVVLLGSIASSKYVDALVSVFGRRLLFPAAFVGRGDMSRGGLLLRSVADRRELDYVPVEGAVRHGVRPPRLPRRTRPPAAP